MKIALNLSKTRLAEISGEFLGTFFFLFVLFLSPIAIGGNEPLLVGFAYMVLMLVFGVFSKGHFNPIFSLADFFLTLWQAIKSKNFKNIKPEAIKLAGYLGAQLLAAIIAFALAYRFRNVMADFQILTAGYEGTQEIKDQIYDSTIYGTKFNPVFINLAFVLEAFFSFALVLFYQITANSEKKNWTPFILGMSLFVFMVFAKDITGAAFHPFRSLASAVFLGGEYLNSLWLFLVAPILGSILASALYFGLSLIKPAVKKV